MGGKEPCPSNKTGFPIIAVTSFHLNRGVREGATWKALSSASIGGRKDNPRSFVGIVEEVGVEEKKAFTNIDELWHILNSLKHELTKPATRILLKKEDDNRKEVRISKEIPFPFIYNKRKIQAETVNISKHGLSIRINEKISLPVGNIMNLQASDKSEKAKVIWCDDNSNPSITTAGFRLMDGKLNLNGAKKNTHL